MKPSLTKYHLFAGALIVALIIPLILYGYIGLFTRYVADDYETAGALARSGFWGAQHYWYQTWSGRISYFALVTVIEMLGIQVVPYLTSICLVLWMIGLYWVLRQMASIAKIKYPVITSCLGVCLILFVTLRSLNQIHQILFWQTGLLTYATYLIFFTFGIAWLLSWMRTQHQKSATFVELIVCLVYAFLIGGMSEISIALQITVILSSLTFLLIFPGIPSRKKGLGFAITALIGSVVSLMIMAMAPGNLIRSTLFSDRPTIINLIINSIKYLFMFLGNWIDKQPVLVALAIIIPIMTALITSKKSDLSIQTVADDRKLATSLLLSSIAVFLFLWSGFFTSYAVMSSAPPDRALVIPQFMLVVFLVFWAFQSGRILAFSINWQQVTPRFWKLLGGMVLAICLLLGPIYASYRIAGTIETSRSIAQEWDQRDAIIREAVARGDKSVTVWYIRDLNRLGDYSSDPEFLVNRAAADYYGLETIIALDKK